MLAIIMPLLRSCLFTGLMFSIIMPLLRSYLVRGLMLATIMPLLRSCCFFGVNVFYNNVTPTEFWEKIVIE